MDLKFNSFSFMLAYDWSLVTLKRNQRSGKVSKRLAFADWMFHDFPFEAILKVSIILVSIFHIGNEKAYIIFHSKSFIYFLC